MEYGLLVTMIAVVLIPSIMYLKFWTEWNIMWTFNALGPDALDRVRDCEEYSSLHVDDGQLQLSEFAQMNDDVCIDFCDDDWQEDFDAADSDSDTFLNEDDYTMWAFHMPPPPPPP